MCEIQEATILALSEMQWVLVEIDPQGNWVGGGRGRSLEAV
jgi:hypothetical protein